MGLGVWVLAAVEVKDYEGSVAAGTVTRDRRQLAQSNPEHDPKAEDRYILS
jgi:hypothetical protein